MYVHRSWNAGVHLRVCAHDRRVSTDILLAVMSNDAGGQERQAGSTCKSQEAREEPCACSLELGMGGTDGNVTVGKGRAGVEGGLLHRSFGCNQLSPFWGLGL